MSKRKSSKSRGGPPKPVRKSHSTPRRTTTNNASKSSQPASNPRFSLQDEARFTGGRQTFWNIDTKLRDRGVQFVSAGLHSTMDEVPEESSSSSPQVAAPEQEAAPNPQLGQKDRTDEFSHSSAPVDSSSAAPSLSIDSKLLNNSTSISPQPSLKHTSLSAPTVVSDLFVVDTKGDPQAIPNPRRPYIRSPSPTKSDSSDEVIFHGRASQPRVMEDPIAQSIPQPVEASSSTQQAQSETSWDNTSVEWVHRSKPGVGWAIPKAPKVVTNQPQLLKFRVPKEQAGLHEDTSAADDYLENIKLHDPELLRSATFLQRDIDIELEDSGYVHQQFKNLSVSNRRKHTGETKVVDKDGAATDDDSERSDLDTEVSEEADVGDIDFNDISESDFSGGTDDPNGDKDGDILTNAIDDETLAALLSKQEELGIGSDELLLFDDGVDASVAKAARRYAKNAPKKSRRAKDTFPSATLLADVLEQDPYGGFDIMDFDRPSLRKRQGKGKSTAPELSFDLSDNELQENIQKAWDNDRSKKSARKLERENMRAQGLLGDSGVNSKYGEGMTIWQIGKELENFLASDEQERSLPPMDKRRRAMVHEIATEFNLKTKSTGKGNSRFTKLIRTKVTTQYIEHRFVARARKINMGFFPRMDAKERGKRGLRASTQGGNSSAVRYRDGDIVGGAAPEIGVENKGRAMLEKMGWSSGMALGAHDNKGILEPIAHVVKNSKSGLG